MFSGGIDKQNRAVMGEIIKLIICEKIILKFY